MMIAVAAPVGAAQASTFTRGFTDDVWFSSGPQWVAPTVATGAKMVLLEVDWESVEPTAPPAGVDPTNPAGPEYDFGYLDKRVKEFNGTGMSVAFLVTDAPRWAETPGGPSQFEADGAWKPNATAFGQMATALARRYSGSYPDPASPGNVIPRVRYFQAWAEANFDIHLAPQWVSQGGQFVQTGPTIYRNLLNSFYAGIKAAVPSDTVITTGFGPYGDPPGPCSVNEVGPGCRMPPATFAQSLLCLSSKLKALSCPAPAHFDAMAADPYEVKGPLTHAAVKTDISAPDLSRLSKPLKKAVASGRALPHGHKPLWVTEFSYDSNPPNPGGVSLVKQARWLEQSFFVFWKEGVSVAIWYLVRDQTATFNPANYYSGVYFYNGTKKPSFQAYRFPFVVMPDGKKVLAWGISPSGGKLSVQKEVGKSWKTMFSKSVSAGGIFKRSVSKNLHGNFRAVIGSNTSLVWHR